MAELEKVIDILGACGTDDCDNYPLNGDERCSGFVDVPVEVLMDAIALLKEQEPRVLTLKELQAVETPWNRNTPPYLFVEERSATGSRWMNWGFMRDCVRLPGTMGVQNYGFKWRVWNLQPTPEQMRDTKWEARG